MWHPSCPDQRFDHRLATRVITLNDGSGAPLADVDVSVEQTGHDFLFGNIGFDFIDMANGDESGEAIERLAGDYLDLFNAATLPFYLGQFEPERGKPQTTRLHRTAEWFHERGVLLKGHPLVWHTVAPKWLLDLTNDEVEDVLRKRIRRDVADFSDVMTMWDAINEVVIMPVFTAEENGVTRLAWSKGRIEMIRLAFEEARATNPDVFLLINDFDLSSAYECLLEGMLEAGIVPDAIGLQTHMHQGYRGEENMHAIVERFARYGLPLHLTETSLVSGHIMPPEIVDLNDYQIDSWPSTPEGEERQADEIVRHYTSLVSHPSVKAITYWGITDKGAWLGAPIGLIREDGSHKPSYDALHDLVKREWWVAPASGRTDAEGRFALTGFTGTYQVTAGGQSWTIHCDEAGEAEMTLAPSDAD
ncbi:MAG: endo-1,4-beta-xylanase [Propionibacteriaceae bacterium]|jgi:GH35 family endo-1,4-beta-xylanase|nr:endo-1,4-beta-xylanase [Propionibacteriaceae bacterium]